MSNLTIQNGSEFRFLHIPIPIAHETVTSYICRLFVANRYSKLPTFLNLLNISRTQRDVNYMQDVNFSRELMKRCDLREDETVDDYEKAIFSRAVSNINASKTLLVNNHFVEAPIIYRTCIEHIVRLNYYVKNKEDVLVKYPDSSFPWAMDLAHQSQ
jgi:hypothetical protein